MCYPAQIGHSRSNSMNVFKEGYPKILTLVSHLSRSLKVIGTDTDWCATYDFLLTFRSNHGPILYYFWDKRRFQSKITNFSHPRVFNTSAERVLAIGYRHLGEKTRMMGQPGKEIHLMTYLAVWIQYINVTDRHRSTAKTVLMHSVPR